MTGRVRIGRGKGRTARAAVPAGSGPVPLTRSAYVETYGCQMNLADSELMRGALAERGYLLVEDPSAADVIVVNTCAIREHAERRVRGRIGQLQRHRAERPDLVLAVTGCMAQRLGERLVDGTDGVDLVAGPDAYRRLGELVDGIRFGEVERGRTLLELDAEENYEAMPSLRREGVTAWVTVQRGCDHRCTFCIVPYVRGPEKNRHPGAILGEVRQVASEGFSEVTLLGQTVNSWRREGWSFARLVRETGRVPGIRRVRFTSPHPNDVDGELLDVMAAEPSVCPQLHLPVQSGSDRILKRMVRRYTVASFLETVAEARARVPGIALSTDVIFGFPGETEQDFRATLGLLREVRFDDAYLYRFSPREGTPATRFPESEFVDEETSGARLAEAIELQRRIRRERAEAELGALREVLVEREARSAGDLLGRTETGSMVAFPGPAEWIGEYRSVRLLETTGATFVGEVAA